MAYTVHKLAELAGVTARTLRYYDAIGLLEPDSVNKSGYRLYGQASLARLQQILFYRELEFPLDEIKRIMAAPDFDRLAALEEQKRLLERKRRRLAGLVAAITKTIKHMTDKTPISNEEMYDAFKDNDVKGYQAEAKQRWGSTGAYRQSQERVSKMTNAGMDQYKAESLAHVRAIAALMSKGPRDPEVLRLVAKSHADISFFYDCSLEMFRKLGEMYVADARFSAYYENVAPGLAAFMKEAIDAYCSRQIE